MTLPQKREIGYFEITTHPQTFQPGAGITGAVYVWAPEGSQYTHTTDDQLPF